MTVPTRSARGEWHLVPATTVGPNHVRSGLPSQDAMKQVKIGPDAFMLAVADGAGSRARAEQGSAIAVDVAADAAQELFGRGLPSSVEQWRVAAQRYSQLCLEWFDARVNGLVGAVTRQHGSAGREERGAADFATTLLAVVAAPPWFLCFSVGDGFVVFDRYPGGAHLVVPPPMDRGDAGQAVFLTSANRTDGLRAEVIVDPLACGLALCTDGLIEGMLDYERGHGDDLIAIAPQSFVGYFRFFADPGADVNALTRQLASREFAGTSGDDKTIILAVRR
jgi:serine/threonine protein phosphatase PrpC